MGGTDNIMSHKLNFALVREMLRPKGLAFYGVEVGLFNCVELDSWYFQFESLEEHLRSVSMGRHSYIAHAIAHGITKAFFYNHDNHDIEFSSLRWDDIEGLDEYERLFGCSPGSTINRIKKFLWNDDCVLVVPAPNILESSNKKIPIFSDRKKLYSDFKKFLFSFLQRLLFYIMCLRWFHSRQDDICLHRMLC